MNGNDEIAMSELKPTSSLDKISQYFRKKETNFADSEDAIKTILCTLIYTEESKRVLSERLKVRRGFLDQIEELRKRFNTTTVAVVTAEIELVNVNAEESYNDDRLH